MVFEKTSLKWLTVAIPFLETRERERDKIEIGERDYIGERIMIECTYASTSSRVLN